MQTAACSLTLLAWLLNTGVAGANLTGHKIYALEVSARQERKNLFCWLPGKNPYQNTNLAVTVHATTNPQQRLPEAHR